MRSKTLNDAIVVRMTRTRPIVRIVGSVTCQKQRQAEAPSTLAASYSSWGIVWSAASRKSATRGTLVQIWAKATALIASVGSVSYWIPWPMRPSWRRIELKIPNPALKFIFQAEDGIRDDLVTGVQTCAL